MRIGSNFYTQLTFKSVNKGPYNNGINKHADAADIKSQAPEVKLIENVGPRGTYIQIGENLYLYESDDDHNFNTDAGCTVCNVKSFSEFDGQFRFSVLGSDKKAIVCVPHKHLTNAMLQDSACMVRGASQFQKDIATYLSENPKSLEDVKKQIGQVDLSEADKTRVKALESRS